MADCTASFTVKAFEPPTISCSANPSTVNPGDSATITANGVSPQNRPLTYSYSSTAGSISGTHLDGDAVDDGCGSWTDHGDLQRGGRQGPDRLVDDDGDGYRLLLRRRLRRRRRLCSLSFERDARRPVRVDNEAKACLDDIALKLQSSSDAKLAIVGNEASTEKHADKIRCRARRQREGLPGNRQGHRCLAHHDLHRYRPMRRPRRRR